MTAIIVIVLLVLVMVGVIALFNNETRRMNREWDRLAGRDRRKYGP